MKKFINTESLTSRQEACIARMNEPRTSERRAAKNRAAALRAYAKYARHCGYNEAQISEQLQDIRDVYSLRRFCEEE